MNDDASTPGPVGSPVDRGVGRLEPGRVDPALQEVARKLQEAPPGTLIPVPREAIAAADAPMREALARELAAIRRRERGPLPGADWVADMRARLERPCCGTLHGSAHRATCPEHPLGRHCQNGGDVCLAGNADGICCPEDSCDIDDGARQTPNVGIEPPRSGRLE